ncbi:hypothetical protein ACHAXR_001358 [Thalassiosira sp. AJA248-18]
MAMALCSSCPGRRGERSVVTFKADSRTVTTPLEVHDVIISLNGIKLAEVEGGVRAWVTLFQAFGTGERNLIVQRCCDGGGGSENGATRLATSSTEISSTRAYKAGITTAITELKDLTGSSVITIRKHMLANLLPNTQFLNGVFFNALKQAVDDGDLLQNKISYKLSPAYKKKATKASKPKYASQKKDAPC